MMKRKLELLITISMLFTCISAFAYSNDYRRSLAENPRAASLLNCLENRTLSTGNQYFCLSILATSRIESLTTTQKNTLFTIGTQILQREVTNNGQRSLHFAALAALKHWDSTGKILEKILRSSPQLQHNPFFSAAEKQDQKILDSSQE